VPVKQFAAPLEPFELERQSTISGTRAFEHLLANRAGLDRQQELGTGL